MSTNQAIISSKVRIRLAVSLFFFCHGLAFASWASRIPTIKSSLGISEGMLGTILLLMPVGQLATMTLSGRLVTKYGSKIIMQIASICYALVLCSIAFATDIYVLGACLLAFGVFGNMGNIALNTQAVSVENIYEKPIMSSFHGAWSLAGFFGALIGLATMQFDLSTFHHFLIILSLVIINWVINKSFLLQDPISEHTKKGMVKPDKQIIQLGIICFLVMATEGAMFDWSGVYFKEVVHAPEQWVTLGYTAFMIMMATGRFVGDWVIKQIGRQRTLQISGILMGSGLVIAVLFPQMIICTLAFMLIGIGVATVVPTVYSVAGQHQTIAPGQAIAMVSSISFFGFLIGPPLIGFIAEWLDLSYSFAIFSSFGFILFIFVSTMNIFKSK